MQAGLTYPGADIERSLLIEDGFSGVEECHIRALLQPFFRNADLQMDGYWWRTLRSQYVKHYLGARKFSSIQAEGFPHSAIATTLPGVRTYRVLSEMAGVASTSSPNWFVPTNSNCCPALMTNVCPSSSLT